MQSVTVTMEEAVTATGAAQIEAADIQIDHGNGRATGPANVRHATGHCGIRDRLGGTGPVLPSAETITDEDLFSWTHGFGEPLDTRERGWADASSPPQQIAAYFLLKIYRVFVVPHITLRGSPFGIE